MSTIEAALAGTKSGLGSLKIVMASGLYKTAAGIVGERLLKKHGENLRDYLTIALRSRDLPSAFLASGRRPMPPSP